MKVPPSSPRRSSSLYEKHYTRAVLVRQRVYRIAAGYEDQDDSDTLRADPPYSSCSWGACRRPARTWRAGRRSVGWRTSSAPGPAYAFARALGRGLQNETSAQALATEIVLRGSEEWALERYLTMDTLEAVGQPNPRHSRR